MNPIGTITTSDLSSGTYRFDSQRSKVSFSSKHMFGLGTVYAEFSITTGEVKITRPLTDCTVSVTIDASSFASDNAKRDKDVKAAGLLAVDRYPDIAFTSSAVHSDADGLLIDGHVTAHGATTPARVTVTRMAREADGLRIHADARHLDRYAFGVTGSKGMVGRFLDLEFDVLVTPL